MWYKFIEIILTTMEFKSAGTFPVIIRTYKAGKIPEFSIPKWVKVSPFLGYNIAGMVSLVIIKCF